MSTDPTVTPEPGPDEAAATSAEATRGDGAGAPAEGTDRTGPSASTGAAADPADPADRTGVADSTGGPTTDPVGSPSGHAQAAGPSGAGGADGTTISVEDLVVDLERVSQERNDYLDALRRLQAEFENYRKAVAKRESDARERANEGLVGEMLPVLDACDAAVGHGADDVVPIRSALLDTLTKQGLERIEPVESVFDPERHEAVMHEPSDEPAGPIVTEVLRVGYAWRGRTVRPAMVRVRG